MRAAIKFFLLTYIVSWTLFFAAAAIAEKTHAPLGSLTTLNGYVLLLGVFTPSFVAILLTVNADGRDGLAALLGRITIAPAQARWYVFAIAFFAVIKLSVALIHRLLIGGWPAFGQTPAYIMLGAIVISTPAQAGEEIGWRGYALPRLGEALGLPLASVILGVIWATWHLPFFFLPGNDKTGGPFPMYLLAVTAISVVMAWLYWRTNGSLLMTMLLHAAINNTKDILAPPPPVSNPFTLNTTPAAWLTVALLWACASYFLVRMRSATLTSATLHDKTCGNTA